MSHLRVHPTTQSTFWAAASLAVSLIVPIAALADSACCGNQQATNRDQSEQLRLENATRKAMGKPEIAMKSAAEIRQIEQNLLEFNQRAAKFALENTTDEETALRLFQKMVEERSLPEVPDTKKREFRARTLLNELRTSEDGLSSADFLKNKSFVESSTTLLKAISQGQVPFIIGGTPDTNGQFKDCVAIGNDAAFFCSGTLIHERLVVTAQHCNPQDVTRIFIGQQVSPTLSPDGHTYEVESARSITGMGDAPNDVTVLLLKDPVDPAHATPRKVATVDEAKTAKWCWIAGFGTSFFDPATGASGFGVRRKSPVPLIPGSLTDQAVAEAFGCHFEFEFATGNLMGQASCFGDSGGPVYVITQSNEVKLAGAVSRALKASVIGEEVCGLGAVNTLVPKYPDLLEEPNEGGRPQSEVVHSLSVRRHTTTSLTNSEADQILADATDALQTKDGADDVACDVTLQRQGNVTPFNVGDGTIDSSFELQQILSSPGWIKVVREINWCGGPGSSIIGCAPVPGSSLVVVRFTPNQEGILWLHEFGHNKGLSHRDVANAIMRPFIGVSHRRANQAESESFRSTGMPAESGHFLAGEGDSEEEVSVEEFVKRRYIHGVPWEQAAKYDSKKEVKKLIEMLNDPGAAAYHSNVAATLTLSGHKKAVKPLLEFIEKGEGELSEQAYQAKRTAVMMLGVLVNKTKNESALDFLIETARQKGAVNEFEWTVPGDSEAAYRRERMATMAIWGLSLSGQPKAIEALEELKAETPANFDNQSGTAVIREALETSKKVRELGVMEYHAEQHKNE